MARVARALPPALYYILLCCIITLPFSFKQILSSNITIEGTQTVVSCSRLDHSTHCVYIFLTAALSEISVTFIPTSLNENAFTLYIFSCKQYWRSWSRWRRTNRMCCKRLPWKCNCNNRETEFSTFNGCRTSQRHYHTKLRWCFRYRYTHSC